MMTELDTAIAPLVERLNAAGARTFQSCSGHATAESHPSAHIWLVPEYGVTEYFADAEWLSQQPGIEQVALLWGREAEPVFEIVFVGETLPGFQDACNAIELAFGERTQ